MATVGGGGAISRGPSGTDLGGSTTGLVRTVSDLGSEGALSRSNSLVERLIRNRNVVEMANSFIDAMKENVSKSKRRQVTGDQAQALDTENSKIFRGVKYGNIREVEDVLREEMATKGSLKQIMESRGSVGETIFLYSLLVMDRLDPYDTGRQIVTLLMNKYPECVFDLYVGSVYEDESTLHMAIMKREPQLVEELLRVAKLKGRVHELLHRKTSGSKFSPGNEIYYGGYPLFFAACIDSEQDKEIVLLLLECEGGREILDKEDQYGNTVFHMLAYHNRRQMYEFLAKEYDASTFTKNPIKPWDRLNNEKLNAFTVAATTGNENIFAYFMGERVRTEWKYGPIMYRRVTLDDLDTIAPDGSRNRQKSALQIIVEKEHMNFLNFIEIQQVIEAKWMSFAREAFHKRLRIWAFHLLCFTIYVLNRQTSGSGTGDVGGRAQLFKDQWYNQDYPSFGYSILLAFCEIFLFLNCVKKLVIEAREMLEDGMAYFQASGSMFLENTTSVAHSVALITSILVRYNSDTKNSSLEDVSLGMASVFGWCYVLFFFIGFRFLGPFVVMIVKMGKDVIRFGTIYVAFLMAFSTALYIMYKEQGIVDMVERVQKCFMIILGGGAGDEENGAFCSMALIVYTFISAILLLNLLIAMMGDTYQKVSAEAHSQWYLERARIISSLENEMSTGELIDRQKYRQQCNGDPHVYLYYLTENLDWSKLKAAGLDEATTPRKESQITDPERPSPKPTLEIFPQSRQKTFVERPSAFRLPPNRESPHPSSYQSSTMSRMAPKEFERMDTTVIPESFLNMDTNASLESVPESEDSERRGLKRSGHDLWGDAKDRIKRSKV